MNCSAAAGDDFDGPTPRSADQCDPCRSASVTVDGEIVATDAKGVTDFDRLRLALSARSQEAFLYAFDILELDGEDLRRRPWVERRAALAQLLRSTADSIALSEHMAGPDGEAMFPPRLRHGPRRHREQRGRPAFHVRPLARLDQDQEPERSGRGEAHRRN